MLEQGPARQVGLHVSRPELDGPVQVREGLSGVAGRQSKAKPVLSFGVGGMPAHVPFQVRECILLVAGGCVSEPARETRRLISGFEFQVIAEEQSRIAEEARLSGGLGQQPRNLRVLRRQLPSFRQDADRIAEALLSRQGAPQLVQQLRILRPYAQGRFENFLSPLRMARVNGRHGEIVKHVEVGRLRFESAREQRFGPAEVAGLGERQSKRMPGGRAVCLFFELIEDRERFGFTSGKRECPRAKQVKSRSRGCIGAQAVEPPQCFRAVVTFHGQAGQLQVCVAVTGLERHHFTECLPRFG